jgi:hypothetical protein
VGEGWRQNLETGGEEAEERISNSGGTEIKERERRRGIARRGTASRAKKVYER